MTTPPRRAPTLESDLTVEDRRWLSAIGWSDAAVPAIRDEREAQDYARRERLINAALEGLSFAERADSAEGRLAAALGAALANWRERDDEE